MKGGNYIAKDISRRCQGHALTLFSKFLHRVVIKHIDEILEEYGEHYLWAEEEKHVEAAKAELRKAAKRLFTVGRRLEKTGEPPGGWNPRPKKQRSRRRKKRR